MVMLQLLRGGSSVDPIIAIPAVVTNGGNGSLMAAENDDEGYDGARLLLAIATTK